MKSSAKVVFAAVMFCFLVSGIAGLVYQVVWTRYLALFLGHTSYAVVAVLVAFMGGLALGNAWLGARADRVEKPLAFYGWLEIGITVYAAFFPVYYQLCHGAFVSVAERLEPGSGMLLFLKFLFSFATVLFPTTLMGATFPVLTRFVTRSLAELREKVAALYFINSLGAVFGCLIADFWWVPKLGLDLTVFCGAGLNLAAGLVALYLSKRFGEGAVSIPVATVTNTAEETFSPVELRLALVGIGISGFVAMLYEVAWTRALALALGSSTHAFSLMLATFISGIALGAWIVYRSRRLGRSLEAFAWAELVLGLTVLVSMFFYAEVPYWFVRGASMLSRQPQAYVVYELLQALICFGVMFLPATCLGLTLPLVSRIATLELARTGRSVGRVFAVNTVGTVMGAVGTGLWLMPWLGLAKTFAVGVALNALIGLAILFRDRLSPWRWLTAGFAAFCFVWGMGMALDSSWQRALSAGVWREAQLPTTRKAFQQLARDGRILYHRDGAGATVTVTAHSRGGGKKSLSLKVNGKIDAGTASDVTTQKLIGHFPLLLRPDSKRALVVGIGSGMTAAAVARHPSIERVDVVEITPEVVEAAKFFADYNDRFWEQPKIHITVEDAKSFLKIGRGLFDVIISEPSNPWMVGVAGVFSEEYYQDCRARLATSGVMVQWVQIYETNDELLDIVLRTFGSVFPNMSLWRTAGGDLVLIGSVEPMAIDLEAMRARFIHPSVSSDLALIELVSLPVLLANEVVSQSNGAFLAPAAGPTHSDYYPVLEFAAAKAFFARGQANRWRQLDEKLSPRPTTLLGEYLKKHPLTEVDFKALGRYYLAHRLPESDLFRTVLLRWQREQPQSTLPMELMSQASDRVVTAELEMHRLAPMADYLVQLAERDPEPLRQYESYLMQTYRAHRSAFNLPPTEFLETVLRRLLQTNPTNQRVYRSHLAEIAWDRGDDATCAELGRMALDPNPALGGPPTFAVDPKAPRLLLTRMVETLWRAGKLQDAFALCETAARLGLLGGDPVLDLLCRKVEYTLAQTQKP